MNKLRKKILSLVTAAALAFTSIGAMPDIGGIRLPDLSVKASADASSLPEAENGVIKLTEDTTIESWLSGDYSESGFTFDLNGHTLTVDNPKNDHAFQIEGGNVVTVKNGTLNVASHGYNMPIWISNGTLILDNAAVTATAEYPNTYAGIFADSNTTLTIKNGSKITNTTFKMVDSATVTIDSSTLSGTGIDISMVDSITSSVIDGTAYDANGVEGWLVTFDSKGGSSVPFKIATKGSTITAPTDPTREGYTFKGWYADEDCTGDAFDFANTAITADTTLYAKWLQHITYIGADGKPASTDDYTLVTSSDTKVTWAAGTYVVADDDVEISGQVTLKQDTTLILCDGAKLTVTGTSDDSAITGGNFTVYGQSGGSGTLEAKGTGNYSAGINVVNLTINGGTVISSGYVAIYSSDDVIINGGTVTASSSPRGIRSGNLTIKGGNVTALGTSYGVWINNSGAVTLDWTKPTDSIKLDTIENATSITFTKPFVISGTNTLATADNIAGKTLVPAYGVTVADGIEHGTVTASPAAFAIDGFASANKTVTVTASPDANYQLDTLTVTDESGNNVTVSGTGNSRTFTMPASNVTVSATFTQIPVTYIDANGETQSCTSYTVLTGSETGDDTLAPGWYVVNDTLNYTNVLNFNSGDVNLILCDNKSLNIGTLVSPVQDTGLNVRGSLTVYGQGTGNGALNIYTSDKCCILTLGDFTQNGGNIKLVSTSNEGLFTSNTGSVNINNGSLDITAGSYGIVSIRDVNINGGVIKINAEGTYSIQCGSNYIVNLSWTKPSDSITLNKGTNIMFRKKSFAIKGTNTLADSNNYLGNTIVPACKFTIKGNKPTGVALNADGTVTPPATAKKGITFDGWYTDDQYKNKCAADYFSNPITDTVEFYGRYVVEYVGADGKPASTDDYTLITSSDDEVILSAGTYVVADDVTVRNIILTGDVDLIVCNDCSLYVNNQTFYQGSNIEGENYTLNVFAQKKTDEASTVGGINAYNCTVKALNLYSGCINIDYITAESFTQKCGYINVSEVMNCPSISLDWSSSGDYFYAKAFSNTTNNINLVKGFCDGGALYFGTLTSEQIEAIADKNLVPAYKVTFRAEGVEDTLKGVPATGEATVESLTLTNDNHQIAVWYADEQLTEKADFTKPITEDTIFYGKWIDCGIFFDTDGGTEIDPITNVTAKQRIAKPENPTKKGHTFQYWTLDGSKVNFPYYVPETYDGTAQIIFKAVWKANTYKVTFNSNGGSAVKAQTVEYNKPAEEPTAPTKKNYDFVEWQLDGVKYDFATLVTADITLDAVWKGAEYTVTYMVDGKKFCEETFEHGDIVYSDSSAVLSEMMKAEIFVDGWYTAANLRTKYAPKAITGDLTLYGKSAAFGDIGDYEVELNSAGVSGTGIVFKTLADALGAIGKTFVIDKDAIRKQYNADNVYFVTFLKTVTSTKALTVPKTDMVVYLNGDLTLKGATSITSASSLAIVNVDCTDAKGAPSALTINMNCVGGTLTLNGTLSAKSVTLKGAKGSALNDRKVNTFDSVTGFETVMIVKSMTVNKTLTADVIGAAQADPVSLTLKSGAALTINKGFKQFRDKNDYLIESFSIKLEKGAKPIVIGKDFDIENSDTIKLIKADENENLDGQQIFTLPTTWKAEQVNAFFAKVDISGITSGGDAYETKLYNNRGKVTLEAYKFKLEVINTGNGEVTETYAFWADAIKRIDEMETGTAMITLLGETTLTKMEMPKSLNFRIKGEKLLTLVGITTISPSCNFEIYAPVTCTDKKGDLSALTINVRKEDGWLIVNSEISCKSLTIKGNKTSAVEFWADNYADSITGLRTVAVFSNLTVNKALTADHLNIRKNCELIVKSGAAVTINKTVESDFEGEKGENAVIKLEKGAKPIVIGKDFIFEDSVTIKLVKADENESFDGVQVFTLPTSWTAEQVNTFFDMVDVSAFQPEDGAYEVKLYNNRGKVTLEAYKISVFSDTKQSTPIGEGTYAFWADAVKAIDASSADKAVISITGDLTLEKMDMPSKPLMIMINGKLTLRGITKIAAKNVLSLSGNVDCYDRTGKNLSALTISGHTIALVTVNGSINAKSLTVTGDNKPGGLLASNGEITVDSISGFETIKGETELHITRTLKTDYIDDNETIIVVEAGAELTINKGLVCNETDKSAEIVLSKGAKPIVIGKNYDIENSGTIKLTKANATDNLDGQQIFTLPTTWTAEQVNAFFAKVYISGITSGGDAYETKLYNNKGKVTLEGYKIKVGDDTYAFWKDAIDAIDKSGAEWPTITLLGDTALTKMEMPKTANLTIDGKDESDTTLTLKGVTSLSPKADLSLNVPVVCVDAKNNPAALTISTAAGKSLSLWETIDCKTLTIKGSKSHELFVKSEITADSITGLRRVVILDGSLTVNKTLTTDILTKSDEAYLVIKSGAAVTVNEKVESCEIRLEKGAKPIVIGKDCFIFSSIKLTKANAEENLDGQQIFTLPTTWKEDQVNAFLAKVKWDALKSGDYPYELAVKSGKVTLVGKPFTLSQEGKDDKYFASWADVITEINKTTGGTYTVNYNGKERIDLGAAFKLPTAGKCEKLTITNGKFIFTGKTVTLTCNLTLTNCTIFDKNGNERSYKDGDYTVNNGKDKYTFEIVIKQ